MQNNVSDGVMELAAGAELSLPILHCKAPLSKIH